MRTFFSRCAPRHGPARRWVTTTAAIAGLLTLGFPQPAYTVATPSLTVRNQTVTEHDSAGLVAKVRVVLSQTTSHRVTVQYETANGTAKTPSDYTAKSGTFAFPAGVKAKTVSVRITGDTRDEARETFRVRIFDPTGAKIADRSGTVTILDNDPMPSLRLSDLSVTEPDAGSERAMDFPVRLSDASGKGVTVDYKVTEGNAAEDRDYVVVDASGELYFPAGTTSRRVKIDVVGDDTDEVDETLEVTLSNPENARLSDGSAVGTIKDNDGPDLSIRNVTVDEGDTAKVVVKLSDTSKQDVSFDYETDEDSAEAPEDYTSESGSKTIDAGDEQVTISVDTKQDSKDEKDEVFSVDLSHVKNASLDDGHGHVTIDDDDGPKLSVEGDTVTEGGTAIFTVKLSEKSVQDVKFHYDTDDGTAVSPEDFDAVSGSKTIEAGDREVEVRVSTENDSKVEPDEKFYLNVTDAENAAISDGRATATIRDNDEATEPKISIPNDQAPEGNTITFFISLDKASTSQVKVDWATENGTAESSDYNGGSGTVTIPAGDKVGHLEITTVDDADTDDETFFVNLSNPVNATIEGGQAQGLIVDND